MPRQLTIPRCSHQLVEQSSHLSLGRHCGGSFVDISINAIRYNSSVFLLCCILYSLTSIASRSFSLFLGLASFRLMTGNDDVLFERPMQSKSTNCNLGEYVDEPIRAAPERLRVVLWVSIPTLRTLRSFTPSMYSPPTSSTNQIACHI